MTSLIYSYLSSPRSGRRKRSCFAAAAIICLSLFAETILAQEATSVSGNPPLAPATLSPDLSSSQGTESAVVLAPFEVQTSQDKGYRAQNTASGTRLNTSLMDTPAPVSVFTSQFIQDIGATNLEDLSLYIPNTSQDLGLLSGSAASGNSLGTSDKQLFFRGLPAGNGRSIDFFQYNLEIDAFDTDRVEFSRGPNSTLFGIAAPAGTLNVTTKRAQTQQSFIDTVARVGSWGFSRFSIDANEPLLNGKVALRVVPLLEDEASWRPNEYKDSKRLYTTGRWEITSKTRLDVEYEGGQISQSVQRRWVSLDDISAWLGDGRPLVAKAGSAAVPGTQVISSGNFTVFNTATGDIEDWKNMTVSAPMMTSAATQPEIADFTEIPRRAVIGGPFVGSNVNYHNYSAFLEQELASKLFIELAYNYQHYRYLTHDVNANGAAAAYALLYDSNAQLPDGTSNPNAGAPYLESNVILRDRSEAEQNYRASLTYAPDLGKILGHYQFLGLAELHIDHFIANEYNETIVQNPPNAADPTATANLLYRQTYVNLGGPVENVALAPYYRQPINGLLDRTTGNAIATAFLPTDTTQTDNRSYLGSQLFGAQAYYWGDRLVGTFGYRYDHLTTYGSSAVRGPAFGPFAQGVYYAKPSPTPTQITSGITRTQGGVFRPFKWIAFSANRSDDFTPPPSGETLLPTNAPVPGQGGRSEDYGLKLDLFGGRVFLTATYYETAGTNISAFYGLFAPPINNIWSTLNQAGIITTAQYNQDIISGSYYTYSDYSHGVEYELTANITPHWRIYGNYSHNITKQGNGGDALVAYLNQNLPTFTAGNNSQLLINGNGAFGAVGGASTIGGQLTTIQNNLNARILGSNGQLVLGNSKDNGSVLTNYDFSTGWLNGIFIGGGLRGRSGLVAGYSASGSAVPGNTNILVDGDMGYNRRFRFRGHAFDWRLQLNVKNVLDDEHLITTNVYASGLRRFYVLQDPRNFSLTSDFKF